MSELTQIIFTSSLTILGGVLIYVIGQVVSKFFIERIHDQANIVGKINDSLIFFANIYSNPGFSLKDKADEASNRLRQLATLLRSKTYMIPWYGFFEKIRIVPKLSDINEASGNLIGLSNSLNRESDRSENNKRVNEIRKLLKLYFK